MEANHFLYPIKFEPILKEKVWGGGKLNSLFNKKGEGRLGESWEISAVEENISVVHNGPLKGKTLQYLVNEFRGKLLGERVYNQFGTKFPLLFKFIDAQEALSVQVHPDDHIAAHRHNSFGKTEMWYIMDADTNANLVLGFNRNISKEEYLKYLQLGKLPEVLNFEKVQKGDAFVLLPGTVHAIGAGVVLAEVQQTSDITYRIYDWDRPDTNGSMRELHTDLALDAINFDAPNARFSYHEQMDVPVQIGKTDFFEVNKLSLSQRRTRKMNFATSFKVYMCVAGEAVITAGNFSEKMKTGETVLIPAIIDEVEFDTSEASFLEAYIP
ncbi:MAG TPA: type I phosphomannose isomerase catalytic subunit [Flavobacteriaceae bacterium]|nr:type I phosphomannose isomerase catalytic subunit [Flavobacteriaceae bacterium]